MMRDIVYRADVESQSTSFQMAHDEHQRGSANLRKAVDKEMPSKEPDEDVTFAAVQAHAIWEHFKAVANTSYIYSLPESAAPKLISLDEALQVPHRKRTELASDGCHRGIQDKDRIDGPPPKRTRPAMIDGRSDNQNKDGSDAKEEFLAAPSASHASMSLAATSASHALTSLAAPARRLSCGPNTQTTVAATSHAPPTSLAASFDGTSGPSTQTTVAATSHASTSVLPSSVPEAPEPSAHDAAPADARDGDMLEPELHSTSNVYFKVVHSSPGNLRAPPIAPGSGRALGGADIAVALHKCVSSSQGQILHSAGDADHAADESQPCFVYAETICSKEHAGTLSNIPLSILAKLGTDVEKVKAEFLA